MRSRRKPKKKYERLAYYDLMHVHMGRAWRKLERLSRMDVIRRFGSLKEYAMRRLFESEIGRKSINAAIALDELDWELQGRHLYLPQNSELMEMLWHAKMNVDFDDIAVARFPRCFSIAWPANTLIDREILPGCLVWCGRWRERDEILKPLERLTGHSVGRAQTDKYTPQPDEWCFHVGYHELQGVNRVYYRCSIPQIWMEDCLKSAENMIDRIGTYGAPMTKGVDKGEQHRQYVVVRSILHLMVYAAACPEAVVDGWPEMVKPDRDHRTAQPFMLQSPVAKQHRTHGSPITHWRNWHFRSYPRQANGQKKDGVVFVKGTLVNADPVDVKTVKKVI